MKHYKFLFLTGIILASAHIVSAQKTSLSAVIKASHFARVELSRVRLRPCEETPKQCALNVLKASDDTVDETPENIEVFNFKTNKIVVLATYKIDEDDSVAGRRYRVEFNKTAGKYEFVQAGKQFKCARGRAGWTKNLCP